MTDSPSIPPSVREEAIDWFTRLNGGEVADPDRRALRAWLEAAPVNRRALDQVTALWESDLLAEACRLTPPPPVTAPTPIRRPPQRTPRRATGGRSWAPLRIAAGVLLLLAATLALGPWGAPTARLAAIFADETTAVGERRAVTLADGSVITLDSDSAMDLDGPPNAPRVTLIRGQAYFDVRPRAPGETFTVDTRTAHVVVVGTAFSVTTERTGTTVAVRHGTVETHAKATGGMDRLTAGQGALVPPDGPLQRRVTSAEDFGWLKGELVFHDRPLGEVLAQVDRHFPGVILTASPRLDAIKVSGVYRLDDPKTLVHSLAQVVRAKVTDLPYVLVLR